MNRKVKREEVLVDDAFLNDDLVEVSHHVLNAWQIGHIHLEPDRLLKVAYLDVDGVRPAQIRSFLFHITGSDLAEYVLLTIFVVPLAFV